ncbi:uncharacterized protein K02A2.6 [Trichonephila clavipes]|nr:uncharacterized protein K02A2.6 [Trichonephila clavipes]
MKYDTAPINFVKENQNKPKTQYNCKKCGRKHKPRECPAFGKICAKCKKKNHFDAKCLQSTKNIHEMNVPENELVYIVSVNENETKCAMENSTDSNFKNVEMASETTWYKKCFIRLNVKSKPILGLRGCKELKLIERIDAIECSTSKNELIKQYKDVFTGVGEFPNEPYHITLRDNAVPVIHPTRRVPLALQPKFKNDIISRLEGKKIFLVVDLKDGFWDVPLDEVSSEFCTFNTPFGRYKFNKMPFGIVSAPEVFQKRNQKLFGNIQGVEIYFDDIIVAGCVEDSHDSIMSRVLERAKLLNIKFNPDKLQYRESEEKYVGQIISKSGGGQLDGWNGIVAGYAARRLNVSRSVVQRLWDQYQSEDSVSRRPVPGRPRATTPAEDRFLALSARRRRTTTVLQLVADHFQASGRRISATTVRNRLHNAATMGFCAVHRRVQIYNESDSGRLLIWREQRTRYHQSNTVERHSYRGGGILVWAGISLGGHTDLHVFHGGTVIGLRYRDEILDPYVRPYAAAVGNDFILMDDNARPHRARIVEEYLEDHGLERMEWPARSPDLKLIEHLWDYLGREVAALNPPPRSLHELKQGLLCVWSSLPIPVSDNLINSMGNRCRQCIQVGGGHSLLEPIFVLFLCHFTT